MCPYIRAIVKKGCTVCSNWRTSVFIYYSRSVKVAQEAMMIVAKALMKMLTYLTALLLLISMKQPEGCLG